MAISSELPIRSIAIFAPNRSSLYINGLLGLKKEFTRRGIVAHVGWGYLGELQLAQFCDVFRPDAILEIDRTRDNAPGMPKDVTSIAWMQDWLSVGEQHIASSSTRIGGSDLNYFVAKPESIGVDTSRLPHWGYLLQATDPDIYFPEDIPMESDFSLIGYVPEREFIDRLDDRLNVEVPGWNVTNFGTIRMLIDALKANGITWNTYDATEARRAINEHVYSFLSMPRNAFWATLQRYRPRPVPAPPVDRCVIPDDLKYFIENQIMRALARSTVAEHVLKVSASLRLFGVGMWQTYPLFAAHYAGPVKTETEVRQIYRSTRINLHNAMTQMHSRALDCMAAGSTIMVNRTRRNDVSEPDCLCAHFTPGVHYFEYGEDDLTERARDLLENTELRRRSGELAALAVHNRHTWSHRVDQIIEDLKQI